jgi:hypothetical protein
MTGEIRLMVKLNRRYPPKLERQFDHINSRDLRPQAEKQPADNKTRLLTVGSVAQAIIVCTR